jgi:hypothetical protein
MCLCCLKRQCQLMFPKAFSKVPTPRADLVNLLYKGWNVNLDRIIFVNGARTSFESIDRTSAHDGMILNTKGDPWRDATMSARGQQPRVTSKQQVHLTDGFHCSDLTLDGAVDPSIAEVHRKAVESMRKWLRSYRPTPRPQNPVKPPRPPPPHLWRPFRTKGRKSKKTNAWMRDGQ